MEISVHVGFLQMHKLSSANTDMILCVVTVMSVLIFFFFFYALQRFVSAAEPLTCLLYSKVHPVM